MTLSVTGSGGALVRRPGRSFQTTLVQEEIGAMPKINILPGRADRNKDPKKEKMVTGTVVAGKRVNAYDTVSAEAPECRLLIAYGKAEPASEADKKAIYAGTKTKAA